MASALSYSSIVPSHKSEKISSITISYIFARATSRPSRRIVNLRFAQALCVAQKLSRRPQTCVAIPPLRAHYAIAQIHSDFGAGLSRETAQRAKSRLISTRLAARCHWHIDCFYQWQSTKTAVHRIVSAMAWLRLRDKLKAPHLRKLDRGSLAQSSRCRMARTSLFQIERGQRTGW